MQPDTPVIRRPYPFPTRNAPIEPFLMVHAGPSYRAHHMPGCLFHRQLWKSLGDCGPACAKALREQQPATCGITMGDEADAPYCAHAFLVWQPRINHVPIMFMSIGAVNCRCG